MTDSFIQKATKLFYPEIDWGGQANELWNLVVCGSKDTMQVDSNVKDLGGLRYRG